MRISPAEIAASVKVPKEDVERSYNEQLGKYTTPEQIRASHILFATEGKDENAVRAQAEQVLKEAKSGADFAGLAKKYSQDETNAQQGGDLDYFSRGRMVAAFDTAAFALAPGEMSDLVKTEFGYHIIKLTDRKPAIVRPAQRTGGVPGNRKRISAGTGRGAGHSARRRDRCARPRRRRRSTKPRRRAASRLKSRAFSRAAA